MGERAVAIQGPLGFPPNIASMRPSDADRGRAVDVLAAAFAEGRLDGGEHRRRVAAALRATSYQELGTLTGDLPSGPLPVPGPAWPVPSGYGHGAPQPYPHVLPVDGCGVASMVLGLIAPFAWFLVGLPSVAAIITGHIALARAGRHSPTSHGMAITGLVLGYFEVLVAFLILLAIVVF